MKNIKRLFVWFMLVSFVVISWYGIEDIVVSYFEVKEIKNSAFETTVEVAKKWRGKCGSGYGNSATFIAKIDGEEVVFTSTCNVPDEVNVGDRYIAKYLKEDPSKNVVLFDRPSL